MRALAVAVGSGACAVAGIAACCAFAGSATLSAGQTRVWAPGRKPVGAAVSCGSHGVRAVARVPLPGIGVSASADGVYGAAELRLQATLGGLVIAACR